MYQSRKSTTEIKTSVRNKIKPKNTWLLVNILITNGIKKSLEIPQNELRKPKKKKKNEVLPFISTFNTNNPPAYNAIKNSVEILQRNNVPGLESIKLINSKRQTPNLKKLLTKAEFSNEEVGFRKCQDLRCECWESLLQYKEYTFKKVNKTFTLKTPMSSNSFNVIYLLICSGCLKEYIGETGVGKPKLRDRVKVYRQHIKQPEHQKLKVEEHIRFRGRDSFKIFPFLQMQSNDTNLRRAYETKFQREYKTKLN